MFTMPKQTIVYIGEGFSVGYDLAYLRRNYNYEYNRIATATNVYFKVYDNPNSWINYVLAIQNNTGTYDERIQKALANPTMRLSADLHELPAVEYTNDEGYQFLIPPNDGTGAYPFWLNREDKGVLPPKVTAIITEQTGDRPDKITLELEYNEIIEDGLITLNTLFTEYTQINPYTIRFVDVQASMLPIKPMNTSDLSKMTYYDLNCNLYLWNGMKKLAPKYPIQKSNTSIIFNQVIDDRSLFVYNGVLYDYKCLNEFEIELDGVNGDQLKEMTLNDMRMIKWVAPDGKDCINKFTTRAINNNTKNSADFIRPVDNSLIVFNGLDMNYQTLGGFSVKYPDYIFGPNTVYNDSIINSISWYYGYPNGGAGLIPGMNPPQASEIIDRYQQYLEDLYKKIMNDYQDELTYNNTNVFKLKYKPMRDDAVLFAVNGVQYDLNEAYTYDSKTNEITWTFTKDNGGFDLLPTYNLTAIYDFRFDQNGITDINQFLNDYLIARKE